MVLKIWTSSEWLRYHLMVKVHKVCKVEVSVRVCNSTNAFWALHYILSFLTLVRCNKAFLVCVQTQEKNLFYHVSAETHPLYRGCLNLACQSEEARVPAGVWLWFWGSSGVSLSSLLVVGESWVMVRQLWLACWLGTNCQGQPGGTFWETLVSVSAGHSPSYRQRILLIKTTEMIICGKNRTLTLNLMPKFFIKWPADFRWDGPMKRHIAHGNIKIRSFLIIKWLCQKGRYGPFRLSLDWWIFQWI